MARFAVGLVLPAALLLATSRGDARQSLPAGTVKVRAPQYLLFSHSSVTVFKLAPTHRPSGVLTLKTLHNGVVETIGFRRFRHLRRGGYVAVQLTDGQLDVAWSLDGDSGQLVQYPVVFPPDSATAVIATMGGVVGPGEFDGEVCIWSLGRYIGKQPPTSPQRAGLFSGMAEATRQEPNKTDYCLTIELDRIESDSASRCSSSAQR